MLKKILISFLLLFILGLGGCYYLVFHSSVPLSAILSMMEKAGIEYEGASGSISNGFKIEKISFPPSGNLTKRSTIEGLEFTYENIISGMQNNEFIINNIAIKSCHIYVERLTDHVSHSKTEAEEDSSDEDQVVREAKQGEPFLLMIKNAKFTNCVIEGELDQSVVNLNLFHMEQFEVHPDRFQLKHLKIEDGLLKRKGQEDARIKQVLVDSVHFSQDKAQIKNILVDCNSFNFNLKEMGDRFSVESEIKTIFHTNIQKDIVFSGECQFIPIQNHSERKFDFNLRGEVLDGEITLKMDEHQTFTSKQLNLYDYLHGITPLNQMNINYSSNGEKMSGDFNLGQQTFKIQQFDVPHKQERVIHSQSLDGEIDLKINIEKGQFKHVLQRKNKAPLNKLLAHCLFQKDFETIKNEAHKNQIAKMLQYFQEISP